MYYVVEFQEEGRLTMDVVPQTWIDKIEGKDMCWWPKNITNLAKHYKSKVKPSEPEFNIYPCKIYSIKDSVISAQRKLRKILDAGSDIEEAILTTDDEFQKRSRSTRKRKAEGNTTSYNKSKSVSSTSLFTPTELDEAVLDSTSDGEPSPDSINVSASSNGNLAPSTLLSLYKSGPEPPKVPATETAESSHIQTLLTKEVFLPYFKTMMTSLNHIRREIGSIKKRLDKMNTAEEPEHNPQMPEALSEWPLKNLVQFNKQELHLDELENYMAAVAWIAKSFQENKWGQMSRNILSKMMEVPLQQHFTFSEKTKSDLVKFESTNGVIRDAVQKSHPSAIQSEVRSCIQNWFQHKTDRKHENKRAKQSVANPSTSTTS